MDRDSEGNTERYMTAREAAQYLGYKLGSLYNKCAAGEIPHLRLGRALRFRRADLDAWVDGQNPVAVVSDEPGAA